MRKILAAIILSVSLIGISGCGNMSPRFDPELHQNIDNENGRIGEIESNQNSLKNELSIIGSRLDRIQNGIFNHQNNNNGLQILSGSGGLFLGMVAILAIFVIMMHYRQKAETAEKAADIMAENIVNRSDPDLEENIFKAAMYTDVEEKVCSLVKKHQEKKMHHSE
tara:strand:+ start:600 stop:1097 length:498 start_codon:yes stop_codon:yes gene_type:complete